MEVQGIKAVWPDWNVVRCIGTGSSGTVYEVERETSGRQEKAVVKVISIPRSESEIDALRSGGYDGQSIAARLQNDMRAVVREYSLMKGCANIVCSDDVKCTRHDDGMGWDVFIRMEQLPSLAEMPDAGITEAQIVRIGTDISNALAFCEQQGLHHRDISPQNIFVAADGTCRLGDLGVAETLSGTAAGRNSFMAPEVCSGQPNHTKSDVYSLGLLLYWLLNERRLPFMPQSPEQPTASMESAANVRRYRGEPLPLPAHGSPELQRTVLTACAYDPNLRFSGTEELRQRLATLAGDGIPYGPQGGNASRGTVPPAKNTVPPVYNHDAPPASNAAPPVYNGYDPASYGAAAPRYGAPQPDYPPPQKKKFNPWIIVAVVALVAVAVLVVLLLGKGRKSEPEMIAPTATAAPPVQTASPPVPTATAAPVWTAAPAAPPAPTAAPTPAPTPVPTATPVPQNHFSRHTGSLYGYQAVKFAYAEASSELTDEGVTFYSGNAIDSNLTTSWQEGVDGLGYGETLTCYFSGEQEIECMRFRMGNVLNYVSNGRPKRLLLEFSDGSSCSYSFPDENTDYLLDLNRTIRTSYVKLTIEEAYPGTRWEDTCITEVSCFRRSPSGTGWPDGYVEPGNSYSVGYVSPYYVEGYWYVQCATHMNLSDAENFAVNMLVPRENLIGRSDEVYITMLDGKYITCVGRYRSSAEANQHRDQLAATFGNYAIIVRYYAP